MATINELHLPQPCVGQRYMDNQGRRWSVRDIRPLGSTDGAYFVLDLDFRSPDHTGATFRMSSQEFSKLASAGGLKPLA